ncbi:MAG: hypothetical protein Q4A67_06735, partial [Aerococcus sp.]|nr:hypothetical protein [Aerococcus sp.]
ETPNPDQPGTETPEQPETANPERPEIPLPADRSPVKDFATTRPIATNAAQAASSQNASVNMTSLPAVDEAETVARAESEQLEKAKAPDTVKHPKSTDKDEAGVTTTEVKKATNFSSWAISLAIVVVLIGLFLWLKRRRQSH